MPAFGDVEMSMNTVENFLDIPIDCYLKVKMKGFKDIIDTLGGITVKNDLNFSIEGTHFLKGELSLNGNEALKFTRMRYDDPRGDFGRQTRQRQIIQGIIKEGSSLSSLTKYNSIFSATGSNQ
jgi:LCP family protein required for cell wall assembly